MEQAQTDGPPEYKFALKYLVSNPLPTHVDPTCYLKASGEALALMFVLCWGATLLFSPDMIAANPLNDRLGYYTLCVGLDSFPANRIGLVFFIPAAYFGLRFVWTDTQLAFLERANLTRSQFAATVGTNACYMVSLSLFVLVFAESPFINHYTHTLFFCQLIIFRLLVVGANFFEAPNRTRSSNVFLAVYTFISLVLPILYMIDFIGFDSDGSIPIPWQIVAAFDYGWFICLALTTKFLPNAPAIKVTWELAEKRS